MRIKAENEWKTFQKFSLLVPYSSGSFSLVPKPPRRTTTLASKGPGYLSMGNCVFTQVLGLKEWVSNDKIRCVCVWGASVQPLKSYQMPDPVFISGWRATMLSKALRSFLCSNYYHLHRPQEK